MGLDMIGICMTHGIPDLPDTDPGSEGNLEAVCKKKKPVKKP